MEKIIYSGAFLLLMSANFIFYLVGFTLPFYFQKTGHLTVFNLGSRSFWQFILTNSDIFSSIVGVILIYFLTLLFLYIKGKWIKKSHVLMASLAFYLLLLPTKLIFSSDVADNIFYGRLVAKYHRLPYPISPSQFSDDPFFKRIGWKEKPVYHGPTSLLIFSGASFVGDFFNLSFFQQVVLLKGIYFFFWLASLVVLVKILIILKSSHSLFWLGILAFNPLVLIETAVNGHDDILMGFFVLLAVFAYLNKRFLLSFITFFGSLFVKYLPLIFLPVIIFHYWNGKAKTTISDFYKNYKKKSISQILSNSKLVFTTIVLAFASLLFYIQGTSFARFSGEFNDSLATLVFMWLERKEIFAHRLYANLLMKVIFIILSLILVFRKKTKNINDLFINLTTFLWLFFLFFNSYFHPWYLIILLFIIPITQSLKEAFKYTVFSVSALFFYPILAFVSSAGKYGPWESQKIAILTIFGPQLIFLIREILISSGAKNET